ADPAFPFAPVPHAWPPSTVAGESPPQSDPRAAVRGAEGEQAEEKMLARIGPTLVGTAITDKPEFRRALLDAVHIDRLNLGPIPTIQLNWLQPHEGNIVDFLFRARAFQLS